MRHLALLLVLAAASAIPVGRAEIAIRHDVDDSLHLELGARYPAVVRVGTNGGDGTLISPDWVLTAAHVAEGMVRRGGGAIDVFVDGQEAGYDVDKVVLHPAFTPKGPNEADRSVWWGASMRDTRRSCWTEGSDRLRSWRRSTISRSRQRSS